jgi:hypothetical protein
VFKVKRESKWNVLKSTSMCKRAKFWENYNRAKKGTKKGLNEAIAQDLDGLHHYYYLGTKE